MNGPPFSVDEAEVHELFAADWAIERVQHQDQLPSEPRFRERGVSRLDEKIFLLRRRPG
jgi:thiopurine S-methyltransferase